MKALTGCATTLLLLTSPLTAAGVSDCADCVEDVVIEADDGRWLAGYVYWNKPPFGFLDLHRKADRLELEQANEGDTPGTIELWPHAVAISRDRLGADFPEPPPAPSSRFVAPSSEVALLVGEPTELPLDSLRRIYPRIGSGLPALRISEPQLNRLAASKLPFHDPRYGEALGAPIGVEDVTIILRSGELASGLMPWHMASLNFQGWGSGDRPCVKPYLKGDCPDVVLWQEAVSGPRRRFASAASISYEGELVKGRGFLRVGSSVLLVGPARVIPQTEIAFILPGPSRSSYPLLIHRQDALRLLLHKPTLAIAMPSVGDAASLYCFSYRPGTVAEGLAEACRQAARERCTPFGALDPDYRPSCRGIHTPGDRREPPAAMGDGVVALVFEMGT